MKSLLGVLFVAGVMVVPGCAASASVSVHPVHRRVVYEREEEVEVITPPRAHVVVVENNVPPNINEYYWYEGRWYFWSGHMHRTG